MIFDDQTINLILLFIIGTYLALQISTLKVLKGKWKCLASPGVMVPLALIFDAWESSLHSLSEPLFFGVICSGIVAYLYLFMLLMALLIMRSFKASAPENQS